jgi:hypothetical protein
MKKAIVAAVAALVVAGGAAFAAAPVRNVSSTRHPNLAAAQRYSQQAWDKIVAAQKVNEWDLGGHAQKAKELLEQANNELKQAAETANTK